MRNDDQDFDNLTVPQQILRVQDLWDRIASGDGIEITPKQRAELERRLHNHEVSPGVYTSWQELRSRLESRER